LFLNDIAEFDRPGVANVDKIKARVSVFLGIPYAQPPIGEARLMVRIHKSQTNLRKNDRIQFFC
jgi:carboxylesterase type B